MKLSAEIKSFNAKSLANGTISVEPKYKRKPIEKGNVPVGVLTRLAIAEEIERILNEALK